ncbi:MAG: tRNA lysidine(34) synthetase TilS [Lamprobacter sp.]|uniref:tRNA lysidine(34) synthetase TilS n=1 Tax=Lamprobacter sp. TaxID=3100796 RepID=UPI002B25C530|nr:tRNA lysidine(34) synthetase TilS [Lamprobacter sp.]MEA3640734.1 tRNA lysidine(34) synthetase TilS [Lamprobacter sp.]
MSDAAFSADRLRPLLASALAQSPQPRRLWIAYSGGCDSHVLLHACVELRAVLGVALTAIHVDHGLHPDSDAWARHCRRVCDQLGVDVHVRRAQIERRPGESLEALARAARRRLFAACLGPGDWLATAQHRDDQAETLLLALLRGSGVHGLAAMPARVALGSGTLMRPLLEFSQADLRVYAERHRLHWLEDPSNQDLGFDRNRLRHQIMPVLRQRWPAAATTIARSAAHCAEAAALIDSMADEQLLTLAGSRPATLSVARLAALAPEPARAVLRRWLARQGFRAPNTLRLESILGGLLRARVDAQPRVAWEGCELRRYRDDLFALAPLPPYPEAELSWDGLQPLPLPMGLGTLSLEADGSARLAVCSASCQALPQALPLTLRFGVPGLRCRQPNRSSRTLKHLFQQRGIPAWLRPYVPLLIEPQGDLLAVAGVAGCGGDSGGRSALSQAPSQRMLRLCWEGHPWTRFGWFAEPVAIRVGSSQDADA